MKAGAYCRVSTDEQQARETIQGQVDFIKRWAELHSVSIVDFYLDDGVSGALPLPNRPEGARLIRDAEAKRVDTVLVLRIDRLSRSVRLLLEAVETLDGFGASLRSLTEEFNTGTAAGRFVMQMLGSVAELERATITERMSLGRLRAAKQSRYIGGPVPYGYTVRDGYFFPDEEPMDCGLSEAQIVRMLYNMLADERGTTVQAAKLMNAMSIPPTIHYWHAHKGMVVRNPGRKWRPNRVRNIIMNPFYRGLNRVSFSQGVAEVEVPPLVDEATWYRANKNMRANRSLPKRQKDFYLLRGLLKCGKCGRTYVGSPSTNRYGRVRYYRCGARNTAVMERCSYPNLNADRAEAMVWGSVRSHLDAPELSPRKGVSTEPLKAAIAEKQRERERILALFRKGYIDEEELDRQLAEVDADLSELRGKMSSLADTKPVDVKSLRRTVRLADAGDMEARREVIVAVVERIVVEADKTLKIAYAF